METTNGSILSTKSNAFADRIIKMAGYLHANADKYLSPLIQQILRSGTSISANIGEAQFASSKGDFSNKFRIALKEANETRTWLERLLNANVITLKQHDSMAKDLNEIIAMLVSSIKTINKDINNKNNASEGNS